MLAEREGTVGELRAELERATAAARHTSLADWLAPPISFGQRGSKRRNQGTVPGTCPERPARATLSAGAEAALGAGAEPRDVGRWSTSTATPAIAANDDHGPRLAEREPDERERNRRHDRGERRVAREEEGDDPDAEPDQPEQRRDAEEGAAGGRDGLAALLEAQEERAPVAEHRRAAGEDAGQLADEQRPHERRHEALGDVEEHDRDPVPAAVGAPDVRRADVAAARLRGRPRPSRPGRASSRTAPTPAGSRRGRRGPRSSPALLQGDLVLRDPVVHDRPVQVVEERVDVGAAVGLEVEEVRVLVDVERDERSRVPDREACSARRRCS